jgi:hypothetical protein
VVYFLCHTSFFQYFECIIKMTKAVYKKPAGNWRMYVKYLIKKNPGVALKKLITGYDKKEYIKFKANPKLFV